MKEYSQANQFDSITFRGKQYPIKFYYGFLFASDELEEQIYDYDTGVAVDDEAERIDDMIACYFDRSSFNHMDGKELYEAFERGENYVGL